MRRLILFLTILLVGAPAIGWGSPPCELPLCQDDPWTWEMVEDRVDTLIQDGTGVTWTYDDGANTLTGDVEVDRLVSALSTLILSDAGADQVLTGNRGDLRVKVAGGDIYFGDHTNQYVNISNNVSGGFGGAAQTIPGVRFYRGTQGIHLGSLDFDFGGGIAADGPVIFMWDGATADPPPEMADAYMWCLAPDVADQLSTAFGQTIGQFSILDGSFNQIFRVATSGDTTILGDTTVGASGNAKDLEVWGHGAFGGPNPEGDPGDAEEIVLYVKDQSAHSGADSLIGVVGIIATLPEDATRTGDAYGFNGLALYEHPEAPASVQDMTGTLYGGATLAQHNADGGDLTDQVGMLGAISITNTGDTTNAACFRSSAALSDDGTVTGDLIHFEVASPAIGSPLTSVGRQIGFYSPDITDPDVTLALGFLMENDSRMAGTTALEFSDTDTYITSPGADLLRLRCLDSIQMRINATNRLAVNSLGAAVTGRIIGDDYYSGDGTQGGTASVSVRKADDSGSCTIEFKDGLYTSTTCT